jgi:AraC family transcriptional activator of tynA and feaB
MRRWGPRGVQPMEVFYAEGATCRERVVSWNAVANDTFGPIDIAPADEASFNARLSRRRSGSVALAGVLSEPAVVVGADKRAATFPGHFVLLNETGESIVSQGSGDVRLGPGALTVISADAPYRISFAERNHMVVTHVPTMLRSVDWERAGLAAHPAADQPLLVELLRHWLRTPARPDSGTFARLVQDVLSVCWAPDTTRTRDDRSVAGEWAGRIVGFVSAHLTDPALSARTAGSALGASTRYVQMVMAEQGTTFSQYVLTRRLARAAEQLLDDRRVSVASIAFACGFSDLSHFSRAFRRQYGCTATDWRRSH